jgi:hypothetical protein
MQFVLIALALAGTASARESSSTNIGDLSSTHMKTTTDCDNQTPASLPPGSTVPTKATARTFTSAHLPTLTPSRTSPRRPSHATSKAGHPFPPSSPSPPATPSHSNGSASPAETTLSTRPTRAPSSPGLRPIPPATGPARSGARSTRKGTTRRARSGPWITSSLPRE